MVIWLFFFLFQSNKKLNHDCFSFFIKEKDSSKIICVVFYFEACFYTEHNIRDNKCLNTIKFDVKKTKKKITIKINGMEKFSKGNACTPNMNAFFKGERFY